MTDLKVTQGSIHKKLDEILAVLHTPLFRYETLFVRFGRHAWKRILDAPLETYDCPICKTRLWFTSQLSYTIENLEPHIEGEKPWETCK
jgi:hypothetical protein